MSIRKEVLLFTSDIRYLADTKFSIRLQPNIRIPGTSTMAGYPALALRPDIRQIVYHVHHYRKDTGCLRNYRKYILLLRLSVLGMLRDFQYIFAVMERFVIKRLSVWDQV